MAGAFALGACQQSDSIPEHQPLVPPSKITEYVAMGDSFVSGPEISPQQGGSNVCLRSLRNYPHLLAKDLGIPKLIDVSCAGAWSYHLLHDVPVPGQAVVPAQLDSLTGRTKLVTLGLGYNHDAFFTKLLASCLAPTEPKVGACQDFVEDEMPDMLKGVRGDVVNVLRKARHKAPNATVILVGYLPIFPEPDTCPANVYPLDAQRNVYAAELAVDDTLRAAASAAGTEFISMRGLGRGHGACAGDAAWVNGSTAPPGDGVVVHPRAVGMQAVADAVAQKLRTYK